MAKIYKKVTDLIGNTPLVELSKYSASKGLKTPGLSSIIKYGSDSIVKRSQLISKLITFVLLKDC